MSPTSFGENEYWDSNDWYYEWRLAALVEPVDADDLGEWYSDYERRLDDEDEEEGDYYGNPDDYERNLGGVSTLENSPKSFAENEYWDSGDWQYEWNLIQTQRVITGSTLVIPHRL